LCPASDDGEIILGVCHFMTRFCELAEYRGFQVTPFMRYFVELEQIFGYFIQGYLEFCIRGKRILGEYHTRG